MNVFAAHLGPWTGSNDFRLMPTDPYSTAPAALTIATAAKGNLATLAYTWEHPVDGAQEGLLVIGPGGDEGGMVAFWGDSWHQHPSPQTLQGVFDNGVVTVEYEYGENWWWRIIVDLTDEAALKLRMDNVVPESAGNADFPGGSYSAMVASFTRTFVG